MQPDDCANDGTVERSQLANGNGRIAVALAAAISYRRSSFEFAWRNRRNSAFGAFASCVGCEFTAVHGNAQVGLNHGMLFTICSLVGDVLNAMNSMRVVLKQQPWKMMETALAMSSSVVLVPVVAQLVLQHDPGFKAQGVLINTQLVLPRDKYTTNSGDR